MIKAKEEPLLQFLLRNFVKNRSIQSEEDHLMSTSNSEDDDKEENNGKKMLIFNKNWNSTLKRFSLLNPLKSNKVYYLFGVPSHLYSIRPSTNSQFKIPTTRSLSSWTTSEIEWSCRSKWPDTRSSYSWALSKPPPISPQCTSTPKKITPPWKVQSERQHSVLWAGPIHPGGNPNLLPNDQFQHPRTKTIILPTNSSTTWWLHVHRLVRFQQTSILKGTSHLFGLRCWLICSWRNKIQNCQCRVNYRLILGCTPVWAIQSVSSMF